MPTDDIDDPDLAEWFQRPPELRALDALEHIMMNLADLPRWACDASPLRESTLMFPVYIACVESYFTNVRLAAEFFWKMPKADITARSFVPDWEVPPGIAKRMERVWLMASKHIVHLSWGRVPAAPDDWRQENMSYGGLMRITRDAFKAFALFIDAYEREGGSEAEWLRDFYQGARPRTQKELAALRRPSRKPPPVVIEWH
ncbi:hypothetical protein PP713_17955 [Mycobacterium sp. CSUR Q5927]|nr:hypothetical protein [Mycobacterium sp. CSUR Q5927]